MAVSKKIQLFELQLYCYQAAKREVLKYPCDDEEDCPFIDGMTMKQLREWIEKRIDMYNVLLSCALQSHVTNSKTEG